MELELTIDKDDYDYEYKRSLINHDGQWSLSGRQAKSINVSPCACWAKESGELGLTGHDRRQCKDGFWAECCSYGHGDAIGIILQLLIDYGVPDLGHRKICLSDDTLAVGASLANHSAWEHVSVLDFLVLDIAK